MKELNWSLFDANFYGKQQSSFERLAYGLFCSRFNQDYGIFSFGNQAGIEAEPIEINGRSIGFQAKYLEPSTSFSSRKNIFIKTLINAKTKNPSLDEIYFYVNKTFYESTKQGQKLPKYILEIEQKGRELNLTIVWQVPSQIQKQLSLSYNSEIAIEFFPEFSKLKINKEELLSVVKTAIILIDIEKILHVRPKGNWKEIESIFEKLVQFEKYSNEVINNRIFDFLEDISNQTRSGIPSTIAAQIFHIIITLFPSFYDENEKTERIRNGEICIEIAFNLIYDSALYLDNYRIIEYGLGIWKYIYREGKRNNIHEWTKSVLDNYKKIEHNLDRPERNDLENSKELIQIFKEDLDNWDLKFPILPDYLYELVLKSN